MRRPSSVPLATFEGLRDKVDGGVHARWASRTTGGRWWTWVCPSDDFTGRLHAAGHARERHAVYTVCDTCGRTFLR